MTCQSEAVIDSKTKFYYANLTCAIIGLQLSFNLFLMADSMVDSFIHQKNVDRRPILIERIKDPREKSYEGKVRSIQFRMKKLVYRADPNRYLISKPSVSDKKVYLIKLKYRYKKLWRFIL